MKAAMYALVTVFFVLVGGLYAGIGWSIAWVLDVGLNLDVNYSFFVWIGLGVYAICIIPLLFFAGVSKIINDKYEDLS